MKKYDVAVVGATGLVGSTFLKLLWEYKFPINTLTLFASERSAGKTVQYRGKEALVKKFNLATVNTPFKNLKKVVLTVLK